MKLIKYFLNLLSLPFPYKTQEHSEHIKKLRVFIKNSFKILPKNIELYILATTHKSASNIDIENNERLEFLGDSVLSMVLSEYLYNKYPSENEGFLTKTKSNLSSRKFLRELACSLNINTIILKDDSLQMNKQKSLEGNTLEALFGALLLDQGYAKTKFVIKECLLKNYEHIEHIINFECNKSLLVEWSQKNKRSLEWQILNIMVEDKPAFRAKVIIDKIEISDAIGPTKKEAQKKAAKAALKKLD